MKEKLLFRVSTFQGEMKEWMDVMHQNPELNMDTHETAEFIAGKLNLWGYVLGGIDRSIFVLLMPMHRWLTTLIPQLLP